MAMNMTVTVTLTPAVGPAAPTAVDVDVHSYQNQKQNQTRNGIYRPKLQPRLQPRYKFRPTIKPNYTPEVKFNHIPSLSFEPKAQPFTFTLDQHGVLVVDSLQTLSQPSPPQLQPPCLFYPVMMEVDVEVENGGNGGVDQGVSAGASTAIQKQSHPDAYQFPSQMDIDM